jgi:hypothetical protein
LHSEEQECRFLLLQCHATPESFCSTLFATVYKRPPEGGLGAFCFLPLAFGLEDFWGLGFLGSFALILLLWDFWCGKLLEGRRITEGKRMAKEELIESLHREL